MEEKLNFSMIGLLMFEEANRRLIISCILIYLRSDFIQRFIITLTGAQ